MSTHSLLAELGTEEIPAGFIGPALDALRTGLEKELAAARLGSTRIHVAGTPRRLTVTADGIAERQEGRELTVTGPARAAAFDKEGKPTKAAEGFARGKGVAVTALQIVQTEKGEYVGLKISEPGRATRDILGEALPRLFGALPFPKSMRWADGETLFARPVQWLVALFGGEVIPFSFAGVRAGAETRGHRFLSPKPFAVRAWADYEAGLRERHVIVDVAVRRAEIQKQLTARAGETRGSLRNDPALLDQVTNLVEWPHALRGAFPEELLRLPPEVLVSEMREHQRYFAIEDGKGGLVPAFIAVSNTPAKDDAIVIRGYQAVLGARFEDAKFYFAEDQKTKLDAWAEKLGGVTFHKKLGTYAEKVTHVRALAAWLVERTGVGVDAGHVDRAAALAKADLVTGMVGEFPELQGTMGGHYGRLGGEPEAVWQGIREHYLPRGASDALPASNVAAIVGIADRLDTLVGIIGIGQAPTGSADPYALRRAALSIIRIVLDRGWHLSLHAAVGKAAELHASRVKRPHAEIVAEVIEFLRTRLRGVLAESHAPDVVDAVLADGLFDDLADSRTRAAALDAFRKDPQFDAFAIAFKRVANIVRDAKAKGAADFGSVDSKLFEKDAERALHAALHTHGKARELTSGELARRDYAAALRALAQLRPAVDAFFTDVFVMVDDARVRANRLALLAEVAALFAGIADFTRLQTQS